MANNVDFTPEIQAFESARYGADVRDAMVSATEKVQEAVNDQLITLDTTLTETGKGADAAATGARFGTVESAVGDLKTAINNVTNTEYVTEWVDDKYIVTNVSPVDLNNIITLENYKYAIIPCVDYDVFYITGHGGSEGRLWCFIDSSGNRTGYSASIITLVHAEIVAPPNSVYLIVNINSNYPFYVYKDLGRNEYYKTNQALSLSEQIEFTGVIGSDLIDQGFYWNTATGLKQSSVSYCCTKELLPYNSPVDKFAISQESQRVLIVCYDSERKFIQLARAYTAGSVSVPSIIPKNTKYIGLNIQLENATKIEAKLLDFIDTIEYPYSNLLYFVSNHIINNSGTFSETSSYDCAFIPVKGGDKFYTNTTLEHNFFCVSSDNTVLSASYENLAKHGRIYRLPNDAVMCGINIKKADTHGNYSDVFYKVSKEKTVLCIGDSITYLDGTTNSYDGATLFLGWQKQLQKQGYKVVSAGYSGYTYATGVTSAGASIGSIYTEIVTNEYDVTGYDYILLTGGTNDDLYEVPVGNVPNAYQGYTVDTTTMLGALMGIIDYIRTNNPSCKIILGTVIKSQSTHRSFSDAKTYADGVKELGDFASCFVCDLFRNFNVQPFSAGWSTFFYDSTHPNKNGMERYGKLVLNALEQA